MARTLTIEQTPYYLQDVILLDDWIAYYHYKDAPHLYLVLRKLRSEYVVHIFNKSTNGYSYGFYSHTYEASFKELKKRAKNSGYNLSQLVQIEGCYGE